MYIAYIEEVDGLKIITGVDIKGIEPIETEKIIFPLLEQSDEIKAVNVRLDKIKAYEKNKNNIRSSAYKLLKTVSVDKSIPIENITDKDFTFQQKDLSMQLDKSFNFNDYQIGELKKEIPDLNYILRLKKISLIKANAIYQETGRNQIDLTELQYNIYKTKLIDIKNYFETTGKLRYLISDGSIIDDNRGCILWSFGDKWKKRIFQFLTDTIDTLEILESELTEEQKEQIRIQLEEERFDALTPEEKENEKASMIAGALSQSVQMRNELEILDDPDALQKVQDWYGIEVLKIEEKYS